MSSPVLPSYVEPASADDGTDAAEPTVASAALVFRVGVADTDYLTHGQVHVLTRLMAAAAARLPVRTRPVVGAVSSSIEVTGAPGDVAEALRAMVSWLGDPDWSGRQAVTEDVLAEGAGLGGVDDELAGAVLSRWGRRGVGLVGLAPVGLAALRDEALDLWRRGYLTAGNACLIADHPALGSLGLTLPEGEAVPPDSSPALPLPLPGRAPRVDRHGAPVPARADASTLTALTRQPAVTRVLAGVLTATLNAREGSAGTRARTRTLALPVGSELLWLYQHDHSGPSEVYAALRSVAHGGLEPGVLEATVRRLSGGRRGNALARAEREALAHLCGLPPIRDLAGVTAEEVVAEAREALPTVLVLGGRDERDEDGTTALRPVEAPPLGAPGEVRGRHESRQHAGGVLTLTEHTCEVVRGTDRHGVAWDDLVAVHYREVDRRVLVPRQGPTLAVDASDWHDGVTAVATIDASVPARLVVPGQPADWSPETVSPAPPTGPWSGPWSGPVTDPATGPGPNLGPGVESPWHRVSDLPRSLQVAALVALLLVGLVLLIVVVG